MPITFPSCPIGLLILSLWSQISKVELFSPCLSISISSRGRSAALQGLPQNCNIQGILAPPLYTALQFLCSCLKHGSPTTPSWRDPDRNIPVGIQGLAKPNQTSGHLVCILTPPFSGQFMPQSRRVYVSYLLSSLTQWWGEILVPFKSMGFSRWISVQPEF